MIAQLKEGFKNGLETVVEDSYVPAQTSDPNSFLYQAGYYAGASCGVVHPKRAERIYTESMRDVPTCFPDDFGEMILFPFQLIIYGVPALIYEPAKERKKNRVQDMKRDGLFEVIKLEVLRSALSLLLKPLFALESLYSAKQDLDYQKKDPHSLIYANSPQ